MVRDEEPRPVRRDRAAARLVPDRDLAEHAEPVVPGERDDGDSPARPVGHERHSSGGIDRDGARIDADRNLRELDEDVPVTLADLEHGEAVRLAVYGDHQLVVARDLDGARASRRPEPLLLARSRGRWKRQQGNGACKQHQGPTAVRLRREPTIHVPSSPFADGPVRSPGPDRAECPAGVPSTSTGACADVLSRILGGAVKVFGWGFWLG